ncbi:hypothetical protein Cgig2_002785 [Carnegiea gigantea]|uniref:LOB domain-containing protein n=1 Tax=Carnegiea gigantea TaxID=171969 RepID=A0A9Q1QL34_9CARY|nr:hypothetical protein Cgig2_002785 [Carnegiea gigantea]
MSSNSPCAACKFLRRKCTQECVFAPYFPPDQPQKFANVHKVFGASNVTKLLNELNASQREDAVNSLAYEADARLRDPVYGCVGLISILQHRLKQVQSDLYNAKKELATYIGPSALMPMLQPTYGPSSSPHLMAYNMGPAAIIAGPSHPGGSQQLVIREAQQQQQQQQQLIEAQQLAAMAVKEEQEMMRNWEHQQHQQQQQQFLRFSGGGGYEVAATGGAGVFNQMGPTTAVASSSLALGATTFDHNVNPYQQLQQDEQQGPLLLLHQPTTPQQGHGEVAQGVPHAVALPSHNQHHHHNHQQRSGSEEGRTTVGPAYILDPHFIENMSFNVKDLRIERKVQSIFVNV